MTIFLEISACCKKIVLLSETYFSRTASNFFHLLGSLEDLVSTFDEKLTMCFQDFQEQVDKIAPVQVTCSVRLEWSYREASPSMR